jgi:putative PEP-CTERM system histidine kinase
MTSELIQWSFALAAAVFAAIAVHRAQLDFSNIRARAFVTALGMTAVYALAMATHGRVSPILAHFRDFSWLTFLYLLWRRGADNHPVATVRGLYFVLATLLTVQIFSSIATLGGDNLGEPAKAAFSAVMLVRLLFGVGALVLVHNLYASTTADGQDRLRLPLTGIAALWLFDLNLHSSAWLAQSWPTDISNLGGLAMLVAALPIAIPPQENRSWGLQLSRTAAIQSASVLTVFVCIIGIVVGTQLLELLGGRLASEGKVAFLFVSLLSALVLLPSQSFRAWLRVKVSKHLFRHRYDYRVEWLRFTNTLGQLDRQDVPLGERMVKAVADVMGAPAGLLLAPDGQGGLVVRSRWNAGTSEMVLLTSSQELAEWMNRTKRVIELDLVRNGEGTEEEERALPDWIIARSESWLLIPLIHFDHLEGIVVLNRPDTGRRLDWEDFDLLRVAGRQAASYLAEAHGQEALSDSRRFEEFNRRFAFIMHDIKNLVSQLGLVARNAERHADNPEFRADMVVTLHESTARMNKMLARLSHHSKGKSEPPQPVDLAAIARDLVTMRKHQHPLVFGGLPSLWAMVDRGRLEQAMTHLIQNAIDASPPTEPVTINVVSSGEHACLEVIDRGHGMSSSFIAEELFRPFTSTKEGGFGIGTFEAKALILEMGGKLRVRSAPGAGSTFTVELAHAAENERGEMEQVAA